LTKDDDSILVERAEDGSSRPADPASVAESLNVKLPWNDGAAQFLTMFYVVLNARTRRMTYVSAGHPGAVRVGRECASELLQGSGLPIGIGEAYEQQVTDLGPGDRVYLYSDGVTEAMNPAHELFGAPRFMEAVSRHSSASLSDSIPLVLAEVEAWRENGPARDDICLLGIEVE
jgi:serine phosphatase RsbU (regulator of sigma subunit)